VNAHLFEPATIGAETFSLMNLTHPRVEKKIIAEMSSGVAVYYDQRWSATAILTEWLANNIGLFRDKRVLILGAGIGAETLILGRHASHIWVNDLAPTALVLCTEQLHENGITSATSLCGKYEDLNLPEVDLVVASFLVYNSETHRAMSRFMDQHQGQIILVNERLAPFPRLLKERKHRILFEEDSAVGVIFD
jgi:predicted nicotinamide N-methyase